MVFKKDAKAHLFEKIRTVVSSTVHNVSDSCFLKNFLALGNLDPTHKHKRGNFGANL